MKKIISIILVVVFSIITLGCSNKKQENIETTMIYPDGLPAIAMSKFIESNSIENLSIKFEKQDTPDALLAELIKGQSDFAVVPSNLALKVAEKNLDYKILGTVGWGSLYLISTEPINNLEDLKNYEVYNTGKGLTPDIVTKNILKSKGIEEDTINFSYVNAASELAPLLISGKAKVAIVPEPILSTIKSKNVNVNIVLELNKEWAASKNAKMGYPQSTLLVKTELFNKLKDDGRLESLNKSLEDSVNWVNDNSNDVAAICESLGITVNKDILPEAIKNGNLKFTTIDKCKEEYIIYFDSIGGDSSVYNKLFE